MPGLRQLPRVLRHRDFRLLWLANSASVVGDRIVTVALALFVVELTGSATDLGIVLAAYSVPLIFFLLVGGVLADRLPRHLVVVVTDLVRFALHALLAVLIVTGEVRAGAPLAMVVPAMVIAGAGVALFDVWWLTALAERISPDKLSRVTSYDWTVSLGLVPLGYVLAGPAADWLGATEVLLGGSIVAFVVLALGSLPRQTRMLERGDRGPAAFALTETHPRMPVA